MTGRRGLTLVELLVACALSAMLIYVIAVTFRGVTHAYDASLSRLDLARKVSGALDRLDRDWAAAIAVPLAPASQLLQCHQADPGRRAALPGGDDIDLRHDELELLLLEPFDRDGDGAVDASRLARVRWSVDWDAARGQGRLVRRASPATVAAFPGLPTLAAPEEESLLDRVFELRLRPWLDGAFREPPRKADVGAWAARFVEEGADGSIVAFDLRVAGAPLARVGPGSLITLRDGRSPRRFDEGAYVVRQRLLEPPATVRLTLATPPGDAAGGVRWQAAWLPPALSVEVDGLVRGPNGDALRRTGRVLARPGDPGAPAGAR